MVGSVDVTASLRSHVFEEHTQQRVTDCILEQLRSGFHLGSEHLSFDKGKSCVNRS